MNPPAADATVDLLLRIARLELETGRDARETILQVVALAPHRHADVLPLCRALAEAGHRASARTCLDVLADLAPLDDVLEDALGELRVLVEREPAAAAAPPLEAVFQEMRTRVSLQADDETARQRFHRGLEHLLGGDADAAIVELQAAALASGFRFTASAQLGRIFFERGEIGESVVWFERAIESPAPTADDEGAVRDALAAALARMPRVRS